MIRLAHSRADATAPAYATIVVSTHQSAQGPVLRRFRDGRVVIDAGYGHLTGRPLGQHSDQQAIWDPLFAGMI